jgi:hypothetical protein
MEIWRREEQFISKGAGLDFKYAVPSTALETAYL